MRAMLWLPAQRLFAATLLAKVQARVKEVRDMRTGFVAVKTAKQTLASKPDDPAAEHKWYRGWPVAWASRPCPRRNPNLGIERNPAPAYRPATCQRRDCA